MSEYDLQFQADLEKAQALSLESLALDQFRRQKQSNADSDVSRHRSCSGPSTRTEIECPPALPPPPRRPRPSTAGIEDQADLISFAATSNNDQTDPHASLKEYINKLTQQTEDVKITNTEPQCNEMNNQYYNNRPPGYVYPSQQYAYNYQNPYNTAPGTPPYPISTPYRMPIPMHNYNYYTTPMGTPGTPVSGTPVMGTPVVGPPESQYNPGYTTPYGVAPRMVAPVGYIGYPPPLNTPQYNYTTNMRPSNIVSRPMTYPQMAHSHSYPRTPTVPGTNLNNNTSTTNTQYVKPNVQNVKPVEAKEKEERNSIKPEFSRKLSEVSIASNESNDIVGSLPKSSNLIDFSGRNGSGNTGSVRVSVLEAFDPLLTEENNTEYALVSEGSSVYEEYDPLEFLYGETQMREEPVYATINKKSDPAPSPPPKSIPAMPAVAKRSTTNKLYDCIVKIRNRNFDNEHRAFLKMVIDVRNRFDHKDKCSNPGHVIAARSTGKYPPKTSIKIIVHHTHSDEPITFTSDVESTVEHVVLTVVCSLDEDIRDDMSGYMLRVWGSNEYLTPGSSLSEYDYIRECVRLEKDVTLYLQEGEDNELARTGRDDARDSHLTLEDLLPSHGPMAMLNFDNLSIFLETLEGELSRAVGEVGAEGSCSSSKVWQAVKAMCTHAGEIETQLITNSLTAFVQVCSPQSENKMMTPEIVGDGGDYCSVAVRSATPREAVALRCSGVRDAVRSLIALYERTRLVDFRLVDTQYLTPTNPEKAVPSHTVTKNTIFCVEAVHRLPPCWNHDEYLFNAHVYYGTRPIRSRLTHSVNVESNGFYPRLLFNAWPMFDEVPVSSLPREARLVLTLYGRTQRVVDGQQDNKEASDDERVQYEQVELGWTALQLFNYDGMLASGSYILPLWPTCADKRTGPAPHPMHSPSQPHPAVTIEIPLHTHTGVRWSSGDEDKEKSISQSDLPSFDSLDAHTQSQLLHLIEQGAYKRMPSDCREILWEKRQYLVELSGGLPLVLQAATHWYGEHRAQLIGLLRLWTKPSPLNAMHFLLPCFPDYAVREMATELIATLSDDDLCRILPQLTQALRHETYECNPLARFLLTRALAAPSVAQTLYWLLVHSLPANSYHELLDAGLEERGAGAACDEPDSAIVSTWRYRLLLRAMVATCGEKLARTLFVEKQLVKTLSEVAESVKTAKEGRQRALCSGAEMLASMVRSEHATLPLGLARRVHDVDVKSCSYFNSNTLPLKINFIGSDNAVIPAMFKVGDDLRQDALVLQVIKVMDDLWLKNNLDLRIVTFQAIPTHNRGGMIEIVSEAETLRAIQTQWGLTGSFKDKPIAEWLAKQNPSELEYQRARDNFTASCAGYSVATFLLGICDRHNDNIMLKTSGHLFHIDFGKFLGDAQMFGNFKRDRAPFVLTPDMVYVINDGERPTQRFHHFVELCCTAFNIVRAHRDHILNLFALMVSSGVPGVTSAAVTYVRDALLPDASNAEAAAEFARLIHSSLKSKFTAINFFLHNLAQLRASGDQSTSSTELLSFMPRTYTMAQEGRLVRVEVLGYEKRYEPEKHYVYALKIDRQGQATPLVLYRSYKHFTELYQKICLHFPLARVHSLPSGLHVGRSNTRQVAERRFGDVQAFLSSLFALADEIAHSDLVYTFFHPLLRDQQDVEPQRMRRRGEGSTAEGGSGSLKVSIQYSGGVLAVLILHAQSLALTPQGLPPNPYVKVYLMPDPTKETKRKTRVLKRNSHPSFMEMLEYRLPMDIIKNRKLHATVWHYDSLQENQFLGGVIIPLNGLPLREETVSWYTLEYIPR